jgi:hypothetical protein
LDGTPDAIVGREIVPRERAVVADVGFTVEMLGAAAS